MLRVVSTSASGIGHALSSVGATGRMLMLSDGRRVRYHVYGDPKGRPVLALHGTPGSLLKFASADAAARRRGIAIVSVDRWGYGASEAPRAPRLSDYAHDMDAVMTQLGWQRFAVLGISGGGPFAVAVAAGLGERITALALVAPVGEIAGHRVGPDGLSLFHGFCFRALASQPIAVRAVFLAFRAILSISGGAAIRISTSRAASADRTIMARPEARRHLAATFKDGLTGLARGPALDLALFRKAWDVEPATAQCEARLWLGAVDRNVPLVSARDLARRLGRCEMVRPADAGHYWIVENTDVVLDWLAGAIERGAITDCATTR